MSDIGKVSESRKPSKRTIIVTASQEMMGKVANVSNGYALHITVGRSPKPEANIYIDGNLLNLREGEEVVIEIRRAR